LAIEAANPPSESSGRASVPSVKSEHQKAKLGHCSVLQHVQ